jgi:hypothetical protein
MNPILLRLITKEMNFIDALIILYDYFDYLYSFCVCTRAGHHGYDDTFAQII